MLIIIAVYGTVIISVRTVLALIYHFMELCRGCCYKPIASPLRATAMNNYWREIRLKWRQLDREVWARNSMIMESKIPNKK